MIEIQSGIPIGTISNQRELAMASQLDGQFRARLVQSSPRLELASFSKLLIVPAIVFAGRAYQEQPGRQQPESQFVWPSVTIGGQQIAAIGEQIEEQIEESELGSNQKTNQKTKLRSKQRELQRLAERQKVSESKFNQISQRFGRRNRNLIKVLLQNKRPERTTGPDTATKRASTRKGITRISANRKSFRGRASEHPRIGKASGEGHQRSIRELQDGHAIG